ncbi:magnesium transporter [Pacificispira sp.]|uniref:magnesium transporter n=1 Tax=Pacificispira sp. TaxID=2888761 RepID=UPI003BAD264B
MSEALEQTESEDADAFDELYGLSHEIVEAVETAVDEGESPSAIRALVIPLHAADLADLLERLPKDDRLAVVHALGEELDSDVFSYLDDSVRESIVDELPNAVLANIVRDLESDDVIDFLEDLDEEDQREILDSVPAEDRVLYEQSLSFPEYSAGRLMRRETVTIPEFWTVGQTIDFMRGEETDLPDDFYNLIVVTPAHKPVGLVQLSKLLRTKRVVPISAVMETDNKVMPADMDQEDVAFLFRQYGLVEAPVVDGDGRLVGVLTIDDIVDVMDEEHEDDILKLGGVSEDDFYSDFMETTRLRFSWLMVNLATAIVASLVIALFEDALTKVVALAVLMPIVASMGGNAGTQTLTVAVRALATNELTTKNALRILVKEVLVGGANGILFAIIMGIIAWLWFSDPLLGGVIAVAMIANLVIAGLCGVLIPLGIEKMGQDPAIASTVFLTTITDVVGFFVFLGLASWVLL